MMHQWGDEWFKKNGEDFDKSINYCIGFWKRWGRIGSHGKEKYGTFRDNVYFWDGGIHSLIWPGYVWVVNKFLYYQIDQKIVIPFMLWSRIIKLGLWYQKQIYNYPIQKMCKKYPHLTDELVSDLDYYDYIKPGIFGKVDGTEIANKYWTKYYHNLNFN